MSGIASVVSSDSHKADVKWDMKIDKLTLLHDIPNQWKVGMVSAMIDLVTDPSNQFKHGISRSYSPGCRGYEVSIEGRVPTSKTPLNWSSKVAYLLQVGPKKSKKPWLRLDINPEALTPTGMAHLEEKLAEVFGVPWPTWRFARVSRIDVAVDLHGVSLTDWVWDLPKRSAREVICRQKEVRTVYLGAKRASPLVVYNKAKQNPSAATGEALTRVEYRAKYKGQVNGLPKLANPFRDVIVFDPGKLLYPDPLRKALRSAGQLHGRRGIVGMFPASQKTPIEQGLIKAGATWWHPVAIWEHWNECLTSTLHSLVEGDDEYGSAATYSFAMKAEPAPEAGNACNQLHDQPA
jgi:hypothetical protein